MFTEVFIVLNKGSGYKPKKRVNKIKDILLTEKIPNDYSTIEAIKNMNVLIQEIQEDKLKPGNL